MTKFERLREELSPHARLDGRGLWAIKGGNSDKRGDRPSNDPPPPPPADSVVQGTVVVVSDTTTAAVTASKTKGNP